MPPFVLHEIWKRDPRVAPLRQALGGIAAICADRQAVAMQGVRLFGRVEQMVRDAFKATE